MDARPQDIAPRGRKRRRKKADKRGVALIMVLGSITVLTVFLTELQEETSTELSSAIVERDTLRGEYLARSAVNLSRLLLANQDAIRSAIPLVGQLPIRIWEAADIALGIFNDEAGVASFGGFVGADIASGKNMGLGGGRFDVKIIAEDGRINMNMASRFTDQPKIQLATRLLFKMQSEEKNPIFEQRDADGQFSDRASICSALIDWADSSPTGSEELFPCDPAAMATGGSKGPEDNYYQNIGLYYIRKNAAYDSLEELRLVRGVNNDIFWSSFFDADPNDPTKRDVTVWGRTNVIDINEASPELLLTLACAAVSQTTPPPLCTPDLAGLSHRVNFLQRAMLLRSLLPPAVPIFARREDFLTLMAGGTPPPASGGGGRNAPPSNPFNFSIVSMIAPQLFSMEPVIPPIPATAYISRNDLLNSIAVSSERFSIYAEGVIPGYKRETRVRVHAVIDNRQGPPPPGTTPTGGNTGVTSSLPAVVSALENPVNKAPGTVLYWRVE